MKIQADPLYDFVRNTSDIDEPQRYLKIVKSDSYADKLKRVGKYRKDTQHIKDKIKQYAKKEKITQRNAYIELYKSYSEIFDYDIYKIKIEGEYSSVLEGIYYSDRLQEFEKFVDDILNIK